MRLLLVRHGVTAYNLERRFTGQSDVSLDPTGLAQAEAVGQALAQTPLAAIVSSDLQRTRVTAQAIARYHDLPVLEDPRLREICLGDWEGSLYGDVARRYPQELQAWRSDPTHTSPPGGETVLQVEQRVLEALEEWRTRYAGQTILWSTHGGVIGILLAHLLGMEPHRREQLRALNASITEVQFNDRNQAALLRFNEATHLAILEDESAQVDQRSALIH